jgi:hypothetical protein
MAVISSSSSSSYRALAIQTYSISMIVGTSIFSLVKLHFSAS